MYCCDNLYKRLFVLAQIGTIQIKIEMSDLLNDKQIIAE
jgi:hypothetical protein